MSAELCVAGGDGGPYATFYAVVEGGEVGDDEGVGYVFCVAGWGVVTGGDRAGNLGKAGFGAGIVGVAGVVMRVGGLFGTGGVLGGDAGECDRGEGS